MSRSPSPIDQLQTLPSEDVPLRRENTILRERVNFLENEVVTLRGEVVTLRSEGDQLRVEGDKLRGEVVTLRRNNSQLTGRMENLERQLQLVIQRAIGDSVGADQEAAVQTGGSDRGLSSPSHHSHLGSHHGSHPSSLVPTEPVPESRDRDEESYNPPSRCVNVNTCGTLFYPFSSH
ncbi:hypothetical protein BT69DRAFT_927321 [Atractiella rhizophila]|nr:hypothetical protein BT69DRAFT_927321 [Atractiella rhizophila]